MGKNGLLYQQVYDEIKSDIRSSLLTPGMKLSSEKQLSDKYDVSVITVKSALRLLAAEGLVKRTPGKGTFVIDGVLASEKNKQLKNESAISVKHRPIIGVVFEHVSSPFGLTMMYNMDRIAMEKGYSLCIRFSYTKQDRETEEIDFLLSLGVSGLIIMPSHGEHYNTKILKLVIDGFPIVLIDKNLDGIPVSAVYTDNEASTGILVDHLVNRGYRNIGLVSSRDIGVSSIKERKHGFYERISAGSLKRNDECVVELRMDSIGTTGISIIENNVQSITKYLKQNPSLDALVSLESGFLPDIYEACRLLNIRIPEDIAICSFDEDYSSPSGYFFTHVKQDEVAIAEKAMELIDSMLNGKFDLKVNNYKIPGIFKEGKSTIIK